MFQGLRENSLIYILDKTAVPKFTVGRVTAFSNPKAKNTPQGAPFPMAVPFQQPPQEMVVELKVDLGEAGQREFVVPATATTTASEDGKIVMAVSPDTLVPDVNGILHKCRAEIANQDYYRQSETACEEILRQLNPQYAKEKERDERIEALEGQINVMGGNLSEIKELLLSLGAGNNQVKN